jgi:hypothetical protein
MASHRGGLSNAERGGTRNPNLDHFKLLRQAGVGIRAVKGSEDAERYTSLSRFTDAGEFRFLLDALPSELDEICAIAEDQSIHHNLLGFFRVSIEDQKQMARVRPPAMAGVLEALSKVRPPGLVRGRPAAQRVIGACILESHLLAGMLRFRQIPTRVRAGYFQDIMTAPNVTLRFWRQALAAREARAADRAADPVAWEKGVDELTRKQIAVDHHIEHWLCEVWDSRSGSWRLVDANRTFLKAHSDIVVPYVLPSRYFQRSYEAWERMRTNRSFEPDQYFEDPQDGRSHIRSQMLSDFYSLLNHDVAGLDESSPDAWEFIKGKTFTQLTEEELGELDALAEVLSKEPTFEELIEFYLASATLRFEAAEKDPYSFIFGVT